ncbi:MAG: TssQ family T6SS-associated lipoprotein [Burkholderiales bacterium]
MQTASIVVVALLAVALAGCETSPMQDVRRLFQSEGEADLKAGIRNYDDGRHAQAAQNFQSALQAGLSKTDEITANKYLAFIACSQKRERQCRAYFRRALELDPGFELTTAEAGHPMWGPVFKSAKGRR